MLLWHLISWRESKFELKLNMRGEETMNCSIPRDLMRLPRLAGDSFSSDLRKAKKKGGDLCAVWYNDQTHRPEIWILGQGYSSRRLYYEASDRLNGYLCVALPWFVNKYCQ